MAESKVLANSRRYTTYLHPGEHYMGATEFLLNQEAPANSPQRNCFPKVLLQFCLNQNTLASCESAAPSRGGASHCKSKDERRLQFAIPKFLFADII